MHGKSCSTGEAGVFLFSQFRHNARHDVSAPNKGGKKKLAWLLPSVEEEEGFSNAEKTKRVEESCHSLYLKLDLHASHHLLITGKKT